MGDEELKQQAYRALFAMLRRLNMGFVNQRDQQAFLVFVGD